MDIATAISLGSSLLELGNHISGLIKKAQTSQDLERRVLHYLEAARTAVQVLGIERQRILTDARSCDVTAPEQVNALWQRLDRYLHEDNIRPQLQNAIDGLRGCREAIEQKAQGLLLAQA